MLHEFFGIFLQFRLVGLITSTSTIHMYANLFKLNKASIKFHDLQSAWNELMKNEYVSFICTWVLCLKCNWLALYALLYTDNGFGMFYNSAHEKIK